MLKIHLRKGETVFLRVQAPKSREIFAVPVELAEENPGDAQAYSNLQDERMKEQARAEILAAAEKLKDPGFYARPDVGYTNVAAHEFGVGGSNPAVSKKQREAGIL